MTVRFAAPFVGVAVALPSLVVFGFRRRERGRAISPGVGDEVALTKGANRAPNDAEAAVQASDSL